MRRIGRFALLLPAVLAAAAGCATRDWTREYVTTEETKINQRMDGLSGQIAETGQVARAARERADAAMNRADGVDGRLTRLWNNRYNQKPAGTVEVFFGLNRADLSDGAQTALLGVVKELQSNPTLTVQLGGFTDPSGGKDYNYQLAQRRVEAVRRFLASQGVPMSRVTGVGMGPVEDRGTPNDQKRRVTVTLLADSE